VKRFEAQDATLQKTVTKHEMAIGDEINQTIEL
jgi:hypothetical protein